jgi:hypothetical protein
MRSHVRYTDGYEHTGTILFNANRRLYISTVCGLLIVPWENIDKTYVSLEDFQEAQRKAKEDNLEATMEEFRKKNAPKHESDGHTWTEI